MRKKIVMLLLAAFMVTGTVTTVNTETKAAITNTTGGTWHEDSHGRWYQLKDGTYVANDFAQIGGKTYFFNQSGYAVTGWEKVDSYWYYFDTRGAMEKGWQKIGSSWYFLDEKDGKMATGLTLIDDYWYYFDGSGAMQTGWRSLAGEWYYFEPGGWAPKGWFWIDGSCYYFYEDGHMAADEKIGADYVNSSGKWCYAHWVYDEKAKQYWYMREDGTYPYDGLDQIDDQLYYFNESGYRQTGWLYLSSDPRVPEGWYYFDDSGEMYNGWLQEGSAWYYLELHLPMPSDEIVKINGWNYYFASNGQMQTDWQYIKGQWYYFEPGGWAPKGWKWIKGNCYYFYEDGHLAIDEKIGNDYVNSSGQWCYAHWIYDEKVKQYWYMREDGTYPSSCLEKIDGNLYCFDMHGYRQTGWQFVANSSDVKDGWHYFDESGKRQTGWLQVGSNWYYFKGENPRTANQMIDINGWKYYFASNGVMQTGWQRIEDKWYYFEPGGWAPKGWQVIDGQYHYFYGDGHMAIDETTPDGFHVDKHGVWVKQTTCKKGAALEAVPFL